jgi:2-methylcitrate dehydratase PrpD
LIHQCGMKAYPAVVYAQTAIVAGIAAAKEVGDLDSIAAIEIATSSRGYEQAGRDREKWSPRNRDTADHSLPYITARAMLDGDISNESYAAYRLRDPRVLALMSKTTVKKDPAFAASSGNATPTRVTAVLKDGRHIAHEIDNMPGFPGKPMTRADVERVGSMTGPGHEQPTRSAVATAASPQRAPITGESRGGRVGPGADTCTAANGPSGSPRLSPFQCILGRDRLP